jgi:L-fuculose-phosphate aldolase
MNALSQPAAIHRPFRTVGAALMRANFNNTHSGNMSCRDPLDPERFWITASGAPCGDLTPADLVAVRFDDMRSTGTARPSSEANTHRRVLELPGVAACVHCHAVASTLISFESRRNPLFLHEAGPAADHPADFIFQPVDAWGAGLIGAVPVGVFQQTVGSSEMERRIPACLRRAQVTIVQGHGPFACGQSLDQCLHHLCVLETSAAVAISLRRRGVDTASLQTAIRTAGARSVFAGTPRGLGSWDPSEVPEVEGACRAEFAAWLSYHFDLGLGAFGTGSMSRRVSADEMIFCPTSAAPQGVAVPLQRLSLRPAAPEAADVRLHRLVYARTAFTACILAASPLATAEATAALAAAAPVEALTLNGTVVTPIDAESAYHGIRLPVTSLPALALDDAGGLVARLLHGGCGLIAGYGVMAAGERGLAQAAYRVSLAERVARFRQEVDLNHRLLGGPPVADFE